MTTADRRDAQLIADSARLLYGNAVVDYLCQYGKMDEKKRIEVGGRRCCLVGALNVAACLVTGKEIAMVETRPADDEMERDYRYATGHPVPIGGDQRLTDMIVQWDRYDGTGERRALQLAALCSPPGEVTT